MSIPSLPGSAVLLGAFLTLFPGCSQEPARRSDSRGGAVAAATAATATTAADGELAAGDLRRSGTIHLDVTGRPETKQPFETAVALLHSFFYDEARRRFDAIAERDPTCAMARWGVAMTWYHPLWAPPTAVERAKGLAAVLEAEAIGGVTELERGLIDAIGTFYRTNEVVLPGGKSSVIAGCNCCGPQAHGARARAFHDKMQALHRRFPQSDEVTCFYALSMLGTVKSTDKTYARQLAAGRLLEPIFARNPDHPGVAHYIIHAYDYPELADKALPAARTYDDIAPWVPHALHMPTHIYTRLGMWEDSIRGNIGSAEAARNHAAKYYAGRATMDELHALDYLAFAYLQTARDDEARGVVEDLRKVRAIEPGNGFASAYAMGAVPARYALERRDWKAAAALTVPLPEFVGKFPMAVAHVEFARAVGGARSGDLRTAKAAVKRLAELRDSLRGSRLSWWTDQVEIQQLAAAGWLARAEGDRAGAEVLLRRAAAIEDEAGTHPVTPGQILPAREQLGDLLFEGGDPAAALVEYELSLQAFPRRFRSHAGAARAAAEIGRKDVARRHYASLLELAGESRHRAEELDPARKFVDGQ